MKASVINIPTQQRNQAVPFTHLIPDNSANVHFYKNGLSKLIPRLTLKVHSDMEKCFNLWDKFSPKQTLFDNWDIRYSFYQGFGFKPHFYTIYEGRKALGVLPLWYNTEDKQFEFFGGWWNEGNSFFVDDEHLVDFFMATLPSPIKLWSMQNEDQLERMKVFGALKKDSDPNFYKNIEGVNSIESLLKEIKKKDRHHLKTDYQRMKNYGVRLEIVENNPSILQDLFAMNQKRFKNSKEKSVFEYEQYRKTFQQFLKNAGSYDVRFFVAKIQNHTAAIDMVLTYKDIYYQFQGVNDTQRFNGIGNYMVYVELEDAIRSGYRMVDCLQEDHSWKHRYFDVQDRFVFEKDR